MVAANFILAVGVIQYAGVAKWAICLKYSIAFHSRFVAITFLFNSVLYVLRIFACTLSSFYPKKVWGEYIGGPLLRSASGTNRPFCKERKRVSGVVVNKVCRKISVEVAVPYVGQEPTSYKPSKNMAYLREFTLRYMP